MRDSSGTNYQGLRNWPRRLRSVLMVALAVSAILPSGCAALLNPAMGIPSNRLPPELLTEPKANLQTIDLALLGQKRPDVYRLAAGDILGVWIEGVLGEKGQLPPVQYSETGKLAPALGYPVPVRDNGTLPLPLVKPLVVAGMSVEEAEQAIIKAYSEEKQILQPGRERIIVTLVSKRKYHVLVIRQEKGGSVNIGRGAGFSVTNVNVQEGAKQGTGHAVDLPAYQNDVLNALAETGGLPGLDAVNEIVIHRGIFSGEQEREVLRQKLHGEPALPTAPPFTDTSTRKIVRIPVRVRKGEKAPFQPDDVILNSGDVVFIDSRTELFYTGGLLGSGQFVLPRDYDLDVITAMAMVGGPIVNGGFNQGNITTASQIAGGVSDITPSQLTILRKVPGGGQVPIHVDMNEAIRDPRRRLLVQAGDILILQQTPGEALTRYFTGKFFFGFGKAWAIRHGNTTTSASGDVGLP